MRIVNIVTQMEAGGAQGAAIRMAAALRQRGHSAETWFLYRKRPTYVGEEGVRVMMDAPPRGMWDYIRIFRRLVAHLMAFGADGVITYTHYANVMGQVAASLVGVPSRVASQRNPAWTYPAGARYADRVIGSLGLYTANVVVSHSIHDSFASYPNSYVRRLHTVHNGISITKSTLTQVEARREFGLPEDVPLVVTVGRLAAQKNQVSLLRVLQRLSGVHLALAGDGELYDDLTRLSLELGLNERVWFLGELSPSTIPSFLRTGDVFAFPSRFEAFGFALVEAMAAGLPVVASNIPSSNEVLGTAIGDPAGLLVPLDDDEAMANALALVLNDPVVHAELARRAAARATMFTLESMVDGYEKCLRIGQTH